MKHTLNAVALAASAALSPFMAFAQNSRPPVVDAENKIVTVSVKSVVDGGQSYVSKIVDCNTGSIFLGKMQTSGYGANSALTTYPQTNNTFKEAQRICKQSGFDITP